LTVKGSFTVEVNLKWFKMDRKILDYTNYFEDYSHGSEFNMGNIFLWNSF
jgi:hypothetical protein